MSATMHDFGNFMQGVMDAEAAERAQSPMGESPIVPPTVGLHRDVPPESYHAWDAASHSRLCAVEVSPAHLRAGAEKMSKWTRDMGTAIHAAILEWDRFQKEYAQAKQCEATTSAKGSPRCSKMGTGCYDGQWFCSTKGHAPEGRESDVFVLSPTQAIQVMAAREAVMKHPEARRLLSGEWFEASAYWIDEEFGVPCKARIDHINEAEDCTVEIKTTRDAGREAFGADAYKFRYYRQGAWYLDALSRFDDVLLLNPLHRIIAIEYENPSLPIVQVYRVPDWLLKAGHMEQRALLRRYAECRERDVWPLEGPQYATQEQELFVPSRATYEIDNRLNPEGE